MTTDRGREAHLLARDLVGALIADDPEAASELLGQVNGTVDLRLAKHVVAVLANYVVGLAGCYALEHPQVAHVAERGDTPEFQAVHNAVRADVWRGFLATLEETDRLLEFRQVVDGPGDDD